VDGARSVELVEAALHFAGRHLRPDGALLAKHYRSPEADAFARERLRPAFRSVSVVKPDSSNSWSREAFWLCRGLRSGDPASAPRDRCGPADDVIQL
jgi:23S rRNA (uridine2552-2'-O)-methyltransferase